jgi:hypothetical protein
MRTDQTANILQRRRVRLAEVANGGLVHQPGGEARNPAYLRCEMVGMYSSGV